MDLHIYFLDDTTKTIPIPFDYTVKDACRTILFKSHLDAVSDKLTEFSLAFYNESKIYWKNLYWLLPDELVSTQTENGIKKVVFLKRYFCSNVDVHFANSYSQLLNFLYYQFLHLFLNGIYNTSEMNTSSLCKFLIATELSNIFTNENTLHFYKKLYLPTFYNDFFDTELLLREYHSIKSIGIDECKYEFIKQLSALDLFQFSIYDNLSFIIVDKTHSQNVLIGINSSILAVLETNSLIPISSFLHSDLIDAYYLVDTPTIFLTYKLIEITIKVNSNCLMPLINTLKLFYHQIRTKDKISHSIPNIYSTSRKSYIDQNSNFIRKSTRIYIKKVPKDQLDKSLTKLLNKDNYIVEPKEGIECANDKKPTLPPKSYPKVYQHPSKIFDHTYGVALNKDSQFIKIDNDTLCPDLFSDQLMDENSISESNKGSHIRRKICKSRQLHGKEIENQQFVTDKSQKKFENDFENDSSINLMPDEIINPIYEDLYSDDEILHKSINLDDNIQIYTCTEQLFNKGEFLSFNSTFPFANSKEFQIINLSDINECDDLYKTVESLNIDKPLQSGIRVSHFNSKSNDPFDPSSNFQNNDFSDDHVNQIRSNVFPKNLNKNLKPTRDNTNHQFLIQTKPARHISNGLKDYTTLSREFRVFYIMLPTFKIHFEVVNINSPVSKLLLKVSKYLGIEHILSEYAFYFQGVPYSRATEQVISLWNINYYGNCDTSNMSLFHNESLNQSCDNKIDKEYLLRRDLSFKSQGIEFSVILQLNRIDKQIFPVCFYRTYPITKSNEKFQCCWLMIVHGNIPISEKNAIIFAALQYQAYFLDRTMGSLNTSFCTPLDFLPIEYRNIKGITSNILNQQLEIEGFNRKYAKEMYISKLAKYVQYYTVFFLVKEVKKKVLKHNKLLPIFFGIYDSGILTIDPLSKSIVNKWDFRILKDWKFTPDAFIFRFGTNNNTYVIKTNQGRCISSLIDYYINGIISRQNSNDYPKIVSTEDTRNEDINSPINDIYLNIAPILHQTHTESEEIVCQNIINVDNEDIYESIDEYSYISLSSDDEVYMENPFTNINFNFN